jgi:DNA invertase Pin-like site-specific DNA recombinase
MGLSPAHQPVAPSGLTWSGPASGVRLRSLHDPTPIDTADTSIMAQISMKLLALFADMERIFMLERVQDARAAKVKRGKRSGPKPKLSPAQRQALAALMADEERSSTAGDVAAGFGISRATLYRELAKAKAAKTTTVSAA